MTALARFCAYRLVDRCSNCDLLLPEPRWRPWWHRSTYCGRECADMVFRERTAL